MKKCNCKNSVCIGWTDDKLICENCGGEIENTTTQMESITEKNMKVVNNFMEHYKRETSDEIDEKIFLSFFNA